MFLDSELRLAVSGFRVDQLRKLRRHSIPRLLATALAFVAIVGQLSSFAHLGLVRHVTCAEHGELIEVGHNQPRAAMAPAAEQATAVLTASSSSDTHGHDHCLLAPMRRDRAMLGTPTVLDSTHVGAYGTIGRFPVSEVPPAIAVILLAPKNSPPIA